MHTRRNHSRQSICLVALLMFIMGTLDAPRDASAHNRLRTFDGPEQAVKALLRAVADDDAEALRSLFGWKHEEALLGADVDAARVARAEFVHNAQEMHRLAETGPDTRVLLVGKQAWPFPVPLKKGRGGWQFDTAEGIEEIINRRIGRNELSTISMMQEYVNAQYEYALEDRDGDDVLEYAQKLESSPDKKDGLYWAISENGQVSPFGPLIAAASAHVNGGRPGQPFRGYYYRVLTSQGASAPGGAHDYIIKGNMVAGFALIAFPAEYGSTGIMTFMVCSRGKVYQRDLGTGTAAAVASIKAFDPDSSWELVEANELP